MKHIIIIVFLFIPIMSFSQKDIVKSSLKQNIEYYHNISVQVNPAGDYLESIIKKQSLKSNYVNWHGAIRYTYTIHPNILIGGEASYSSFEYFGNSSNKKQEDRVYGYYAHDFGALARFIYNKPQWCRPFADIILGYRRAYYFHDDYYCPDIDKPKLLDVNNEFQWYAALGVSFRFWQNHFNIDLMCKASTYTFVDFRRITFGWKIGYNFNQ